MATPFLSEIKMVSFNFPPKGWAFCNGQLLPINQNQALFSLLGTTYGGNGQTNFALPNLRGQTPIHMGSGHTLGEAAGVTAVTLTLGQMPTHTHLLQGSNALATANAAGRDATNKFLGKPQVLAQGGNTTAVSLYGAATQLTTLAADTLTTYGGSQPHNNMMPYMVLNFIIALQGIFPSQN